MKILVVDQFFYPEEFQINDICEQLVADGHEVTVLTGLPNYPSGIIPKEYKKGKKRDEYIKNGIHVIRSFEIGRRKGAIGLIVNYFSFCISATLKALFMREKFDVVFAYETSPVLMVYPAEVYARKNKTPLFLYCCDIWPECAKVMVKNEKSIFFKMITKMSTYLYRRADLVGVQSKGFYQYFDEIHGIKEKDLRYLPQYADSSYVEQDFTPDDNGVVDFVFLGNIGIAQDIGGLISAVEQIKDISGFKVHLVGEGSFYEEAKLLVKEKNLTDIIKFYGRRPYEEMPKFYKLADVCLATLQAGNKISLTIPAKVQGYMAAGKPVIAALSGFARDIIENSGSGIGVEPGSVDELANAMKEVICNSEKYSDCGRCAREYYVNNFTKDHYMRNLYSYFDEVIAMKKLMS